MSSLVREKEQFVKTLFLSLVFISLWASPLRGESCYRALYRTFALCDRNADGYVREGERIEVYQYALKALANDPEGSLTNVFDTDRSGSITPLDLGRIISIESLTASNCSIYRLRAFVALDLNHDGNIQASEYDAVRQLLLSNMGSVANDDLKRRLDFDKNQLLTPTDLGYLINAVSEFGL